MGLTEITDAYEREHRYCVVCQNPGEKHHIVTRGAGGCNCEENIVYLCRIHHSKIHEGGRRWVRKYNLEGLWERAREHRRSC